MSIESLPKYAEWHLAAVHLLQGVVYADEVRVWETILASQPSLTTYFGRLGLLLIVDEAESLAYLRQMTEDEMPEGYEHLPKLFHKTRLSYNATLLCVLLREELRRFEEEDVHNERCVVEIAPLFDQWRTFSPPLQDEVRQRRELGTMLNKLGELGYVRKFSEEPEAWEIRRILKARLPAAELENLKLQLQDAANRRDQKETTGDSLDG
jgi:hypothetical protein